MAKSFLDTTGLDALWLKLKTAISALVVEVSGKVSKDGDTMSGDLDMGTNCITNCNEIGAASGNELMVNSYTCFDNGARFNGNNLNMEGGEINMGESGISNCTFIEGGGDNDTVRFDSNIGLDGYGFYQEADGIAGTANHLVQGNGHFRDIADTIMEDGSVIVDKIPTTDVVHNHIQKMLDYSRTRSLTYSELKTLRDNGQLLSGQWYRITDFVTVVSYTYVQSAGNAFDILVFAVESNKLSETAFACRHSGDTYFANSKLEAWELRYCLDNDRTRFIWANASTGKGVIYYMKDEFNNSAPYDFKNIKFRAKFINASAVTPSNVYTDSNRSRTAAISSILSYSSNYLFTFSTSSGTDATLISSVRGNTILPYKVSGVQYLNCIVLRAGNSTQSIYNMRFGNDCRNISIDVSNYMYNSTFEFAYNVYITATYIRHFEFGIEVNDVAIYSLNLVENLFIGNRVDHLIVAGNSHFRNLYFAGCNARICLYGCSAQSNHFGTNITDFHWIEQATFPQNYGTPTFTDTPSVDMCAGYFLYNDIYINTYYVNIGIPFFMNNVFIGAVSYAIFNKLSTATYSFNTPTHYLNIAGGAYGTKTGGGIFTPPNNSASTVFIRKSGTTTIEV